jgi:hypothetical protein
LNAAPEGTEFKIEDSTPAKLRLQRNVSSADAQIGDKIDFDVLDDVIVSGMLVIPKGSVAWGTVTEAQPKRRMARGGKLDVNIDSVRLSDGEKCPLRAVKYVEGGGHTGAMTAGIVATGHLVSLPAAPFFLFMHGKDVTIPEGTEITAYVNGDMRLDPAKFAVGTASTLTASSAPAPAGNAASPPFIAVSFTSTPDGADITVDSKFVGSTPSNVELTPGDHAIHIEKSGFKPWQRTLTVAAGASPTINASLEKDAHMN